MFNDLFLVLYFILAVFSLLILCFFLVSNSSNLEIKKQKLPNHVERGFFRALKLSAIEHGYSGFFLTFRYFLRRLRDHTYQVISRIVPWSGVRVRLQRRRGVSIGKNVMLGPLVTIDDVYPNFVIIESGVSLAGQNFILSHNKPLTYHRQISESFVAPTIIRKDAWIAVGVIVLPGVEIGKGSIVASGSVVTKNIPSFVLAGGVPAKVIREFDMKDNVPVGYKEKT
jgi:acetyltransferase-like isoleucine patch superfamily enzyme